MTTSRQLISQAIDYTALVPSNESVNACKARLQVYQNEDVFRFFPEFNHLIVYNHLTAFDILDALELLIIHTINRHLAIETCYQKGFLQNLFDFLRQLQNIHCLLCIYIHKKHLPIWVYDRRKIFKENRKLVYGHEEESLESINELYHQIIKRFSIVDDNEGTKISDSFIIDSLLIKAISRPRGRYLVRKVLDRSLSRKMLIHVQEHHEFSTGTEGLHCIYQKNSEKSFIKSYEIKNQVRAIFFLIQQIPDYTYLINPNLYYFSDADHEIKAFYASAGCIMLHELQHIKCQLKSIARDSFPMDQQAKKLWTNQEEWHAIKGSATSESVMLEEHGLPSRIFHKGYPIDNIGNLHLDLQKINLLIKGNPKNIYFNPHLQAQ